MTTCNHFHSLLALAIVSIASLPGFAQTAKNDDVNEGYRLMSTIMVFSQALARPDVCRDLEIVPGQKEKLKDIVQNYHQEFGKMVNDGNEDIFRIQSQGLPADEQAKQIKATRQRNEKALSEFVNEYIKRLRSELLPHQYDRLNQLVTQRTIIEKSRGKTGSPIKFILDELDLSKNEKSQYSKKLDELDQEFKEELKKLKIKYGKKALAILPKQARKKAEQELGTFEYFIHQ